MTQQKTIIVKSRYNGFRLDQYLREILPSLGWTNLTRQEIQRHIEDGHIQAKGVVVRSGYRIKPGETVSISIPSSKKTAAAKAWTTEIAVMSENASFLVLNKPAGLSMHPAREGQTGTLKDWILEKYPKLKKVGEDLERPGIVHRLDKETSGLVILAKTNKAFKALKKLFQERKVKKVYLALVYGHMTEKSGVIEKPMGRLKGSLRRGTQDKRRTFAGETREAVTHYELHTRYPQYDFLELEPKTGRTHQIRVHLSSLMHPVVGDGLYRFKAHRSDILSPPHQLLHASRLAFTLFEKEYAFEAPLPDYFKDTLKRLDAETKKG